MIWSQAVRRSLTQYWGRVTEGGRKKRDQHNLSPSNPHICAPSHLLSLILSSTHIHTLHIYTYTHRKTHIFWIQPAVETCAGTHHLPSGERATYYFDLFTAWKLWLPPDSYLKEGREREDQQLSGKRTESCAWLSSWWGRRWKLISYCTILKKKADAWLNEGGADNWGRSLPKTHLASASITSH